MKSSILLRNNKQRCRLQFHFLADLMKSSNATSIASSSSNSYSCAQPHRHHNRHQHCTTINRRILTVCLVVAITTTSFASHQSGQAHAASSSLRSINDSHNYERRTSLLPEGNSRAHRSQPIEHQQARHHQFKHQSTQPLPLPSDSELVVGDTNRLAPLQPPPPPPHHSQRDLPAGDQQQLFEPMTFEASANDRPHLIRSSSGTTNYNDNNNYDYYHTTPLDSDKISGGSSSSGGSGSSGDNDDANTDDEAAENTQDSDIFLNNHKSQLRAMRDMFERRQLNNNNNNNGAANLGQSSQELSPIAIGLDGPGLPFSMPPFAIGGGGGHGDVNSPPPHPKMGHQMSANADNFDQTLGPVGGGGVGGGGPALPFGLNPLPHLMGFQGGPYDGPQRGDQPAYTNHHAASAGAGAAAGGGQAASQDRGSVVEMEQNQKVWPKIFRFTDGRINLSDFEKQKKVRLSSKNQQHGDNHIESAPIMFDGRPLKRKSFLILHGGVFQTN